MSNSNSIWQAAAPAQLLWPESGCPQSVQFDDIYYSQHNGLEESRHVFLAGNNLPNAWASREHFSIAETGFGTGLNFLATWQAWQEDEQRCTQLHYLAVEMYPLAYADMEKALAAWPQLEPLARALLAQIPTPLPGRHRLVFEQGAVVLDLVFADAQTALEEMTAEPGSRFDCWYLDGFAPARNPQMWQPGLYAAMARLSRTDASFATFSAAGQVRRELQDAGFRVEKKPGYASKREMLQGHYAHGRSIENAPASAWNISPAPAGEEKNVMVLGAGLAGATVANALARRGWRVQVLEQQQVAAAASGMLQGALYTRISHRPSSLNSYSVHSFAYASRFYRDLLDRGLLTPGLDGELCGALHLHEAVESGHPLQRTLASMPRLLRYLNSEEAAAVSGLERCPPGLFYPDAGWMRPAAVCRVLLRHPSIELLENTGRLEFQYHSGQWLALDDCGQEVTRAPLAVVAGGSESRQLPLLDWLPTQSIRGQVSHLPSQGKMTALKTVICHEGYIAPAREGLHCIGASFHINDPEPMPRLTDHEQNLEKLHRALSLPDFPAATSDDLAGRVGWRCASPDYLPMVGPVPDREAFLRDYAALRKNAHSQIDKLPTHLPGLYLSTAHGSRGLTYAPLAAELLAAQICGQPWPLDERLCRALNPARFILRELARNRI